MEGPIRAVMELLQGMPLANYLRRPEANSLEAKLDLMMQVCEGLQVAHDRGVIHRDVKPSNLFVQNDGSLKILDFGVARLATATLTAGGALVGTPDYMSPEQAMGRAIDARSDVFSAAAVFYFMLTGRAPFDSDDLPKVLNAVMFHPPAPLTDQEAPDALQRVLDEVIARFSRRFPDFSRLADSASLMEPMDPSVAAAALTVLQKLHNTEAAAVAALQAEAADSCRRAPDAAKRSHALAPDDHRRRESVRDRRPGGCPRAVGFVPRPCRGVSERLLTARGQ